MEKLTRRKAAIWKLLLNWDFQTSLLTIGNVRKVSTFRRITFSPSPITIFAFETGSPDEIYGLVIRGCEMMASRCRSGMCRTIINATSKTNFDSGLRNITLKVFGLMAVPKRQGEKTIL